MLWLWVILGVFAYSIIGFLTAFITSYINDLVGGYVTHFGQLDGDDILFMCFWPAFVVAGIIISPFIIYKIMRG